MVCITVHNSQQQFTNRLPSFTNMTWEDNVFPLNYTCFGKYIKKAVDALSIYFLFWFQTF